MQPGKRTDTTDDITITDAQQDNFADVRVMLLSDDETPTVALVEERLWHVRQLYALSLLLRIPVLGDVDIIPIAALMLQGDRDGDIDPGGDVEELLPAPLRLQIRAAGTGTFWVDLFLQTQSILHHLPDIKTTAEWLKNAREALTSVAAIASLLGVRLHLGGKEPADKQKTDAANDALSDTIRRRNELKDVSAQDKEQIGSAVNYYAKTILGPRAKLLQGLPPSSQTQPKS
jgi:hypothetical protein